MKDCPAAGPQIEVGGVAEPAADVLGLGHHRPHHLNGGVDHDLAFDPLGDHALPPSCATKGCLTLAVAIEASIFLACRSRRSALAVVNQAADRLTHAPSEQDPD